MKRVSLFLLLLMSMSCFAKAQNVDFDAKMKDFGLVDVKILDPSISVKLMYSTTDNFVGLDMYGELENAYLTSEMADMVVVAQKELKKINPNYSIIILDAARPISIQRRMFDVVAGTPSSGYVANPNNLNGRHNYAMAVDVSIIDQNGNELDMGCPVDTFSALSHTDNEAQNMKNGTLIASAHQNRELLRKVMSIAGFTGISNEWWHFQKYSIDYLKSNYKVLDF